MVLKSLGIIIKEHFSKSHFLFRWKVKILQSYSGITKAAIPLFENFAQSFKYLTQCKMGNRIEITISVGLSFQTIPIQL